MAVAAIVLTGCRGDRVTTLDFGEPDCTAIPTQWRPDREYTKTGKHWGTNPWISLLPGAPDSVALSFDWSIDAYLVSFVTKTVQQIPADRVRPIPEDQKLPFMGGHETLASEGKESEFTWILDDRAYHTTGKFSIQARYSTGRSYIEIWSGFAQDLHGYTGTDYIEIFRVKDQKRMATITIEYTRWPDSIQESGSGWPSDRDYVLLSGKQQRRQIFVCRFPEEQK